MARPDDSYSIEGEGGRKVKVRTALVDVKLERRGAVREVLLLAPADVVCLQLAGGQVANYATTMGRVSTWDDWKLKKFL